MPLHPFTRLFCLQPDGTAHAPEEGANRATSFEQPDCQSAQGCEKKAAHNFTGGPLQHASEFLHQIKSARAAASASVAEFRHLVSLQRQEGSENAPGEQLHHQPRALEAGPEQEYGSLQVAATDPQQHEQKLDAHNSTQGQSADDLVHALAAKMNLQQLLLKDAEAEAAEAQADLLQAHAQLAAAQQELECLKAGRLELQDNMRDVQACVSSLEQKLQTAAHNYAAAQAQWTSLHQGAAILQSQVQEAQQNMQQRNLQLQQTQQELVQAQQQLREAAEESAQFKTQLAAANAHGQASEQVLQTAADNVSAACSQLQQVVAANQQLQTLLLDMHVQQEHKQQLLDDLVGQKQELQEQQQQQAAVHAAATAKKHHMQQQLVAAKTAVHETASMVQLLERELTALQLQLRTMQAAAAAAVALQQQLWEAQAAAEGFKQQLAAAESERAAAAEHSQDQEQQLQELQARLETTTAWLSDAQQEAQDMQLAERKTFEELQALEAELAEARHQLEQARRAHPTSPSGDKQQQHQSSSNQQQQATQQLLVGGTAAPAAAECPSQQLSSHTGNRPSLQPGIAGSGSSVAGSTRPATVTQHAWEMTTLVDNALLASVPISGAAAAVPVDNDGAIKLWSGQATAEAEGKAEAPTTSLLDELRHESDELAEQLTQLQQYLKTTSSRYGDLGSLEAMDEGLRALRRVTDSVVVVAASTVERVNARNPVQSAPTSMAGRAPSTAGVAAEQRLKHASCAGAVETAAADPQPTGKTVAMRRLGLELPRLQSWGSEVAPVEPFVQPVCTWQACSTRQAAASLPGADRLDEASEEPSPDAAPAATASVSGNIPADSTAVTASAATAAADLLPAAQDSGACLDHWGSMSEAACTWLAGDLQVEEEMAASFPSTPMGSFTASPSAATAAATAARVPSRLAAVSTAAGGLAEPSLLAAWGSGMLPVSGAGAAAAHEQQQATSPSGEQSLQLPQTMAPAGTSPSVLQQQLQDALSQVRQLYSERVMLQSQVQQLAELAQQQEEKLAVNDELLQVLTTGLLTGSK